MSCTYVDAAPSPGPGRAGLADGGVPLALALDMYAPSLADGGVPLALADYVCKYVDASACPLSSICAFMYAPAPQSLPGTSAYIYSPSLSGLELVGNGLADYAYVCSERQYIYRVGDYLCTHTHALRQGWNSSGTGSPTARRPTQVALPHMWRQVKPPDPPN